MSVLKPKKKPDKQKEMGAASLLRMAKDARELVTNTSAIKNPASIYDDCRMALQAFAEIHEREAKRLRAMR